MDHRTCAQTQCALSMREVDNALNALHALERRGQGHFRSYFLCDELLALLCTHEMYVQIAVPLAVEDANSKLCDIFDGVDIGTEESVDNCSVNIP